MVGLVEHNAPHSPILAPCQAPPACIAAHQRQRRDDRGVGGAPGDDDIGAGGAARRRSARPRRGRRYWRSPRSSPGVERAAAAPAGGSGLPPAPRGTRAGGCCECSRATFSRQAQFGGKFAGDLDTSSRPSHRRRRSRRCRCTSGTPASARACISTRHSALVEAREYFDTPAPEIGAAAESVDPPSTRSCRASLATPAGQRLRVVAEAEGAGGDQDAGRHQSPSSPAVGAGFVSSRAGRSARRTRQWRRSRARSR